MKPLDPNTDFYHYKPLQNWQGVIQYFGALTQKPQWKTLLPLFDLLKQLSTSCLSADFHPTIVNDEVVLSREPLDVGPANQPRVTVSMPDARNVTIRIRDAGEADERTVTCEREIALHMLNKILSQC